MVDIILRLIRFLMISMAFIINIFTYINWRKSIILESNQTYTQATLTRVTSVIIA